ncbi:MAG: type II secretion system F family protein [Endomicrobiia bacterium]|nr:type II secretion system F family protein [Endomicrobiia bacterium]
MIAIIIMAVAVLAAAAASFFLFSKIIVGVRASWTDFALTAAKIRKAADRGRDVAGAKFSVETITAALRDSPDSSVARYFRLIVAAFTAAVTLLVFGANAVIFAFIFGFAGYMIPSAVVKYLENKKLGIFEEQLMDALGTISTAMRAGSSLVQAMEVVTAEAASPLKEEFSEVLRQVQLGNSIDKALKEMTERVKSQDLRLAVLAITVTREYGGNLGENLMRISAVMRERKKIRGKIDAITAQGRLSGWVVTFVPLGLLFVLKWMEPEMFGLMFTTFLGNILLGISVILVSIGNYVIMKIVKIDI